MPLDKEYLKTFGEEWPYTAPRQMAWEHFFREAEEPEKADDEIVVLTRVLAHPLNSEMDLPTSIVRKVNGVEIKSLDALAKVVAGARQGKEKFLVLELDGKKIETLDVAQAEAAHDAILKNYGISRDQRL